MIKRVFDTTLYDKARSRLTIIWASVSTSWQWFVVSKNIMFK